MQRFFRFFVSLAVASVALATFSVVVASPADAVTKQFTWFNQSLTHTATSYAQPGQSAATPANWVSPTNYAGGKVFMKLVITAKPSTKPTLVQLCVWRNNYSQ
jgi:hypothetical protein